MEEKKDRTWQHDEARWLAFTQLGGWNVTIREGVSRKEIDSLFAAIEYANQKAADLFTSIPQAQQEQSAPPQAPVPRTTENARAAAPVQPRAAGAARGDSEDNPRRVSKIVISGTKANMVADLYSPNVRLKFPVFKVPVDLLVDILSQRYPAQDGWNVEQFRELGEEFAVDWLVTWERSPKDERWKDILSIQALDWEQGDNR